MKFRKIVTIIKRDGMRFTIRRSIAWILGHSVFSNAFSFTYYKKCRLVFAPSMLTYILFASEEVRSNDTDVLEKFLQSGDTMIDVGAHIGSMAVVGASIVGTSGKVLAFEPVPKFYTILNKNIEINSYENIITSYPYALGATAQEIFMNADVSDDTTNHVAKTGTPVKQVPLDELTKDIETVSVLKIDVEGYEPEVLLGAPQTLSKTKVIFIEFYTKNLRHLGCDPKSVIEPLKQYFNLYVQDSDMQSVFSYTEDQEYEINLIGLQKS